MENWRPWYDALVKPSWTPPAGTISTIWTVLYPIIAISFGFVFFQFFKKRVKGRVVVPFIVNLAVNLLFTPIFFGLQNISLATFDILIVWATTLWIIKTVWKRYRWVALAQIPYLVWVTIAATLQLKIFLNN